MGLTKMGQASQATWRWAALCAAFRPSELHKCLLMQLARFATPLIHRWSCWVAAWLAHVLRSTHAVFGSSYFLAHGTLAGKPQDCGRRANRMCGADHVARHVQC